MASWRALGPQFVLGGSWGDLGGSWAALGGSLSRLGPSRSPGGPGRLRGRAPGGHFGAFLDGPAPEAEKATKNYNSMFYRFSVFWDRVLVLMFAICLLAWYASGEAAII